MFGNIAREKLVEVLVVLLGVGLINEAAVSW